MLRRKGEASNGDTEAKKIELAHCVGKENRSPSVQIQFVDSVREGFKTPSHGKLPKKTSWTRGVPPPPLTDGRFPKTERKKVNGKGGYPPPPLRTLSVTGGFDPFPYGDISGMV